MGRPRRDATRRDATRRDAKKKTTPHNAQERAATACHVGCLVAQFLPFASTSACRRYKLYSSLQGTDRSFS
jgi:hypothetical protein